MLAGAGEWLAASVILLIVLVLALLGIRRLRRRPVNAREAAEQFRRHREMLEADFFALASSSGVPRGLQWENIDFADAVTYAKDRVSGQLVAFVEATIQFSAVAGGGMEDVEAVSNLRAATTVFELGDVGWGTRGRVIYNLRPEEALAKFDASLEPLADVGHRSPGDTQSGHDA